MSETKIENSVIGLTKSLDEASGAITAHIENLKAPFNDLTISFRDLTTSFKDYSKKTGKLTKWLIFWTGVMALAVIGQIIQLF